jgi:hypothetical protein
MGVKDGCCSPDIAYAVWAGLVIGASLIIAGITGLRRS